MTKDECDKFLHKEIMLITTNNYCLTGTLEYNDKKSYPDDLYMILTNTDTTYFINPKEIERMIEYKDIRRNG